MLSFLLSPYFLAAAVVVILMFGLAVLVGAPYVPTFRKQTETALDLLDLKQGQTLLELGCGDGRVLALAAGRGLRAVGYEINPLLVIIAKIRTWPHRRLVSVKWGDYWRADWPKADGIYVFLLDKYMKKLDKNIVQRITGPVKLASFAFQVPDKKPVAEKDGIYLYHYSSSVKTTD